jgi:HlyD family secretion protein
MNSSAPIAKKAPVSRWLPYAGGAALVALLAFGLRPQPATVETARAINGALRATVSEEGKTRIRQRYVVSSPVTGQLRRVPFKPGAEITAASIVAVIEPLAASPLDPRSRALAETRRFAATAALEKSRAAHALAINELGRMTRMFADKTVSPQDLETIQLRETAAARDLITTEGALRSIEAELADSALGSSISLIEVKAPSAGRVLHVFQESQRPITAGTPILDVGDPSDLEVVIELLSRDGAALSPGTRVELEQWGGPQPLDARVRLVEPAAFTKISALGVEEQRVKVRLGNHRRQTGLRLGHRQVAAQLRQQRLRVLFQLGIGLGTASGHGLDQRANVVAAGQQQHHQLVGNAELASAHLVQHAFNHMGEGDDVVQAEQARGAFDGVGSAKNRVHHFVFFFGIFDCEQGVFHVPQQLTALHDEGLQCIIKIHGYSW